MIIFNFSFRYTEESKKMHSFFDSQYLWNNMTCSYSSCAERVIICVRSDHHQRLNSVDAAELSELNWTELVWRLHMTLRWFLVARSVWLASNLSWIRAIVQRVSGQVPNSFCHCRRTSLLFSYFQHHLNTALRCSKDNLSAIVTAVYCSRRPRGTTITWHMCKHYTTVRARIETTCHLVTILARYCSTVM
jgi:hypothetical protein